MDRYIPAMRRQRSYTGLFNTTRYAELR